MLAAALSTVGCAAEQVSLDLGPREYVASDYERLLRRWTRTGELIQLDVLDNVLTATATYRSWDFRWAYVVRYSEDYRLTIDQRRALLARERQDVRREHEFFLALYAQRPKWGDLNVDNPAWIVRLIDDEGNETAPSEIERIRKPGALEQTYFPYTTAWRMAYRVHFPVVDAVGKRSISPTARWFGLRFTGPQGHQDLVWEIESQPLRTPADEFAAPLDGTPEAPAAPPASEPSTTSATGSVSLSANSP